jgi:hypothetical protein
MFVFLVEDVNGEKLLDQVLSGVNTINSTKATLVQISNNGFVS